MQAKGSSRPIPHVFAPVKKSDTAEQSIMWAHDLVSLKGASSNEIHKIAITCLELQIGFVPWPNFFKFKR